MGIGDRTQRIADGLANWLQFERHCERESLFSEAYLAHPLGQLLRINLKRPVQAEYPHPILNTNSVGRPPSVDFFVRKGRTAGAVAIETKWVSESSTPSSLVLEILRDVIRLDLLMPAHASEAFFIIAGIKADIDKLFRSRSFTHKSSDGRLFRILPTGKSKENRSEIRKLQNPPKWKADHYHKALDSLKEQRGRDLWVSPEITVTLNRSFPREAKKQDAVVFLWRIRCGKRKFKY